MADYTNYVLSNPDLRENAEALGLTPSEMAEWGQWHWDTYGKNENRQNTKDEITNDSGYTETLTAEHYQNRDVNEVLQASVRSAYGGDFDESMWTARENIDSDWNLKQYIADNWNMDPDTAYKSGILDNSIEVNADIGQLVPTPAGDQQFLQDRYYDDYIANDFPVDWVTDQLWTDDAPEQLGAFWDVLTNAYREDSGLLRRKEDYDPDTATGPSTDPGPRGKYDRPDDTTNGTTDDTDIVTDVDSAVGDMNLLAYRPGSQDYWDEYIPKASHGLLDPDLPGSAGPGIAYLPGEHRDPGHWQDWVLGGHTGQPPGGAWVGDDKFYNVRIDPKTGKRYKKDEGPHARWNFTSPSFRSSIQDTAWKPSWANITEKQGADWMDFYENLGGTPEIDTSIKTLLGV